MFHFTETAKEEDKEEIEMKHITFGEHEEITPSGSPSMMYEKKTKTWFNNEFSDLVKMFPVQNFQNPPCEFTPEALEIFENKVQSWVDASLCKTRTQEEERELEQCRIEYDFQSKEEGKHVLSRHESVTNEACNKDTVTVKFIINKANIFTHAFEVFSYMQDVKESLAKTFKCPSSNLLLVRDGKILSDSLRISELDVEPYGSVEIDVEAKGSLKLESIYQIPPYVPDVITVRVESGKSLCEFKNQLNL